MGALHRLDLGDFAAQVTQQIEVVHDVDEHHAGSALAVPRCIGEVGVLFACGPEAADGDDLSDLAVVDRRAGSRDRGVVPSMMSDQQPPAQACDRVDESKRLRIVDGDRLLEEYCDARLEAFDCGVDVKRVGVGDDDRVEILGVQHGCGAPIGRTLERALDGGGIGDRRQRGARRRSNEVEVLTPHEAGADDADANGRGLGCSHGASLRRCGCGGAEPSVGHDPAARGTRSIQRRSPLQPCGESMFHSTGHRFANRTKSVRVSTATKP